MAEAGDELVVGDVVGDAARQDHDAEDPGCLVGEVDVGEAADEVNTTGEVGELAQASHDVDQVGGFEHFALPAQASKSVVVRRRVSVHEEPVASGAWPPTRSPVPSQEP